MTAPEQFIVVTKGTRDVKVYTGAGFSKFATRAKIFTGRAGDTYAHIDAVYLAAGVYPGSTDGLDTVTLAGRTPEVAVTEYMAELRREYRMEE